MLLAQTACDLPDQSRCRLLQLMSYQILHFKPVADISGGHFSAAVADVSGGPVQLAVMSQDLKAALVESEAGAHKDFASNIAHPASNDVDGVLDAIGHFEAYQKLHYLMVTAAWIPSAFGTLGMVFVNSDVQWRYPGGSTHHGDIPCDGSDFEIVNPSHSIRAEWGLYCDDGWMATAIDSIYFVGFAIGAAYIGYLGGQIGRRKACALGALVMALCSVGCAFAPDLALYTIFRLGVGVGVGGMSIVAYVLASEFVGQAWQAVTGVGQAGVFACGCVLLVPLAYTCPDWRQLSLIIGGTPLLFLLMLTLVAESPRWLLMQARVEDANSVMREVAAGNGWSLAPDFSLNEAKQQTESVFEGCLLFRMQIMMLAWFANSFVFYGLNLSAGNLWGDLYTNFAVLSVIELLALPLAMYLTDTIGRKSTISCAMALAGGSCAACAVLPGGALTTAAAMIGKFGISASFAVIFVYSTELFPTTVRSFAMGLCSTAARVGGITARPVVRLNVIGDWVPLVLFGVVALVAGLSLLTLPETLGRPLPETVQDCEAHDYTDERDAFLEGGKEVEMAEPQLE